MWILQIISQQMCFCLRALPMTTRFFSTLDHYGIFFLVQTTLDWHECESTWVTIDLLDIEIQRWDA